MFWTKSVQIGPETTVWWSCIWLVCYHRGRQKWEIQFPTFSWYSLSFLSQVGLVPLFSFPFPITKVGIYIFHSHSQSQKWGIGSFLEPTSIYLNYKIRSATRAFFYFLRRASTFGQGFLCPSGQKEKNYAIFSLFRQFFVFSSNLTHLEKIEFKLKEI